ncbi:DUF6817 domain-containing protein [Streptomyces sp. NPDC032472]|uniref:DUF6817 domain-containing protein n=1 Tax=Streptomyces sp. NPDC032472 TaxID=3155018 RepID=UPI0033FA6739
MDQQPHELPSDLRESAALALLRELGAEGIAHPGGSLLAHLQRVRAVLGAWGARPELCLAGLCHAFYGTDGFATALLPLSRRAELAQAIGGEAEGIVYLYASCDRAVSQRVLADDEAGFRDRFTGRVHSPDRRSRRDFAELTAANELDLARRDPAFRAAYGPDLLSLFGGWRELLSEPARQDCRAVLGGS